MNKDFWERIDRLEELAGKATQGKWKNPGRQLIVSNIDKSEPIICDVRGNNSSNDIAFIIAANPAMILEMIAEIRKLEKEADWLAEAANEIGEHDNSDIAWWREQARKAVSEADNV